MNSSSWWHPSACWPTSRQYPSCSGCRHHMRNVVSRHAAQAPAQTMAAIACLTKSWSRSRAAWTFGMFGVVGMLSQVLTVNGKSIGLSLSPAHSCWCSLSLRNQAGSVVGKRGCAIHGLYQLEAKHHFGSPNDPEVSPRALTDSGLDSVSQPA